MNIFYLDSKPSRCAKFHNNKHVVKMIVETAQILSTTHRFIDGKKVFELVKNKKLRRYILPDERENILYKATHFNHPSVKWARESRENYQWLYELFLNLLNEYTFRYKKRHACEKLIKCLKNYPNNIPNTKFTEPPQCMPDYCKRGYSVAGYRNYYLQEKHEMLNYTQRIKPFWINN